MPNTGGGTVENKWFAADVSVTPPHAAPVRSPFYSPSQILGLAFPPHSIKTNKTARGAHRFSQTCPKPEAPNESERALNDLFGSDILTSMRLDPLA